MKLLEVNHLKKVYTTRFGGSKVTALQDVSFDVEQGEYVAVMGESGSGKTTLLNILAALDRPTEGEVLLNGQNIVRIPERTLAAFRPGTSRLRLSGFQPAGQLFAQRQHLLAAGALRHEI